MPEDISGQTPWRRSRLVLRPAAPAAGADWSLTVPAGHQYRIRSVHWVLATSAAVANRVADLVIGDGHGTFAQPCAFAAQAASLTQHYTFFPESGGDNSGNGQTAGMPTVTLEPGWTIGSSTQAIDAGDQFSGIAVYVEDTMVIGGPVDINTVPELIVALL